MPVKAHLEEEIVAALRRILRAIAVHSHRLQEDYGLTGPQLLVLRVVANAGELSMGALARAVAMSQSTTSEIVRRLAAQRLIEWEVGEDRRTKLVRVTTAGEHKAKSGPSLLQDRFQAELEKREEYEQTHILATLQQIASMMDAEDLPAAPILTNERGLESDSGEEE
jgi:DNA-binding MarR family transcriptional regulator